MNLARMTQIADLMVWLERQKALRWSMAGGVCVIDFAVRFLSSAPTSAYFAGSSALAASILGFAPAVWADGLSTVAALWLSHADYQQANYSLAWGVCLAVIGGAFNFVIRREHKLAQDRDRSMRELEEIKHRLENKVKDQGAALRTSDEALHIIFDGVREYAMIMIDNDGMIASWNTGAERIKGWTADEIIGQPYRVLFPEEMRQLGAPERALGIARKTGRFHEKSRRLRKDGSIFVAEITITALFDQDGNPCGFAKITRDVTSNEEVDNIIARNHRAATLGELAGGVAHDFNNVLQIISGGAAMIQEQPTDVSIVTRCADRMARAAVRGSDISGRLLAFARGDGLHFAALDIQSLFNGILELLQPLLPSNIAIKISIHPDLPMVAADRSQLETVLVNLATNARDAMPDGGELLYAASAARVADNALGLRAGEYVRISVRDTGCGMDEKLLSRVAQPYFTTKPKGKGTGLGLAMARRYAEQSGGALQIESEVSKHTEVSIWLPATVDEDKEDKDTTQPDPPTARPIDSLRVLIVEDDEIVREIMAASLTSASTLEARCGEDALRLLTDPAVEVDVLVTNYSLPGMSGIMTIRKAKHLRPTIAALLVTGTIGDSIGTADSDFTMLRKPFSPAQLVEAISGLF